MKAKTVSAVLLVFAAAASSAALPRKIVSAVKVDTPPKVDGVLDDAAWKKAERRIDFEDYLSQRIPRADCPADIMFVHDGKRLYFALRLEFREAPEFEKKRWRNAFAGLGRGGFKFNHLCELFLDPGRSLTTHSQYLLRIDETCAAHMGNIWGNARTDVEFASRVDGRVWTFEFSYPGEGLLENGMMWGVNLSLRDMYHLGDFMRFTGPSNTPQDFTPLLVGGYGEWFNASFAGYAGRIARYRGMLKSGWFTDRLNAADDMLAKARDALGSGARPYEVFVLERACFNALQRMDDQCRLVLAGLEPRVLVKDVDFDEWGWVPIGNGTALEMLRITERGDGFYFEDRGPMVYKPLGRKGYREGFPFPCGRISTDAVKGAALYYGPAQKADRTFFQHGPFYGVFQNGRAYRWEFWVKGKGKYRAAAELRSIPEGGGRTVHTNVIFDERELPRQWEKVSGVFSFPPPPEGRNWENDNGLIFRTFPGTELYLDEIKVWEIPDPAPETGSRQ